MNHRLLLLATLGLTLLAASCTAPTANLGLQDTAPVREASGYSLIDLNSGDPSLKDNGQVNVNFVSNNTWDGVRVAANIPIDEVEIVFSDGSEKDFEVLAGNSGFFPYGSSTSSRDDEDEDDDDKPGRGYGRGKSRGKGKGASGLLTGLLSPVVKVVVVTLKDGSKWYFDRYGNLVPCDAKWYTDAD